MPIRRRFASAHNLGPRSFVFAKHVYQKIAGLTLGAVFVTAPVQRLRRWLGAKGASIVTPPVAAAVVAHLYYLDLLPEILACRATLPGTAPLHLTVPEDKLAAAQDLVAGLPAIVLHPCINRGRDIWPFVKLLNSGALAGYDAVLKLHTKRSPHLLDGNIRRKLLYTMLAGEENAVKRTLGAFLQPTTGMAGWADCWRTAPPYWMANRERVLAIARRMGAPEAAQKLGFFEGSMFWFRPAALAALREMQLTPEDFEVEQGQVDGTFHHALERCFSIAAWSRGYRVTDLRGRPLD